MKFLLRDVDVFIFSNLFYQLPSIIAYAFNFVNTIS